MEIKKLPVYCLLVSILFIISGCVTTTIDAELPKGFARYMGDSGVYRAVNPDGVMFRVRSEPNKPNADLPFWKIAMKKHMIDSGYRFISESDIMSTSGNGYLLELSAPVGDQDYLYFISIFVKKKTIIIVEASGDIIAFNKHRDEIIKSIESVNR